MTKGLRFAAYDEIGGRPNIIVDGYGTEGTVLTLSHWPGSGTPEILKDDLSTMIAFRYLDHPELAVSAEAISNNHFDEDGLCGIYTVLHPSEALERRASLVDVASAGDFAVFASREAFRVAAALMAFADEDRSPLSIFSEPYPRQSAALYSELLPRLPDLLDNPDAYKDLWGPDETALDHTLSAIADGTVTIEEKRNLELAVVTVGDGFTGDLADAAVYTATPMNRVLVQRGHSYELRYRYESWVEYQSRAIPQRVDLRPLAKQLTEAEPAGKWRFESIDNLQPRLRLDGAPSSAIPPERFKASVIEALAAAS
jgi:uncharacterized protein DUF6687